MEIWLIMVTAGLITFGIRLSFILLFDHLEIPPLLRQALRFVPPAVLTAIIIPEMFMPQGTLDVSLGNSRLLAGLLAVVVAWRTRNIVLTILAGMAALLLLQVL
jgi:branched-subunit amino acid transport protein